MTSESAVTNPLWRIGPALWGIVALVLLLLAAGFFSGLENMVQRWNNSEEYGYGYMIPVISLFLIWQRKNQLEELRFSGSWPGAVIAMIGILVAIIGQLSTLYSVTQYGVVIALIASAYALMGWQAFRIILIPLLLLFLMVPLPSFIFNNLSAQLQLISSEIGVAVIRLFGISVYLEGNVIDLGIYKLQVVEACSGLRYLFPLLALSIIASYFYQAALWKRIIVILSSIPITVLMNSFRIGMIGVLVEYGGSEQAEGFLHDFEGWIIFMTCVALLVAEMWLLSRIGRDQRPFRDIFGMTLPEPASTATPTRKRGIPAQATVVLVVLAAGAAGSIYLGDREELTFERAEFITFPLKLGDWRGQSGNLESIILDTLKPEDYLLVNYRNSAQENVTFYVAYYASQRAGASIHSPRSCLPGSGWHIAEHTQTSLDNGMQVNRLLIQKGDFRQLVYYWYRERDRVVTNEFAAKWYLLQDAVTRNRTDGALIRMTTVLNTGEEEQRGDERLRAFASEALPELKEYLPE